ncbi:hypothetical protein OnM2_025114 [Erysiphe neolycopersici]|uniref:Uncharacterized protein n=1 Tax=Erysiphe neolycopersici TaxID=212602 RepID=A0A420I1B8_9PEZI|nr:hypothetical protein OnM2_025114 [Erysiphe neolycopersici]
MRMEIVTRNVINCGGLIKSTMGHPCCHELLGRTEPLSVNDFHQHWWLHQPPRIVEDANNVPNIGDGLISFANKYTVADNHRKKVLLNHILEVPEAMQDPTPIRTRGRPIGSTHRDLSQYEYVENLLNPPRRRPCGRCNREGHNSRTCDLMYVE